LNWIRVDADYEAEDWLVDLPKPIRCAWIDLQLECPRPGRPNGDIPPPSARAWAKLWGWEPDVVAHMLDHADQAGVISIDSDRQVLTILNWREKQHPEACRKQAERQKSKNVPDSPPVSGLSDDVADSPDIRSRATSPITVTEKEKTSYEVQKKKPAPFSCGNELADELVARIRSAPRYEDFTPPVGIVLRVIERLRQTAPDDEFILGLAHGFVEKAQRWHKAKPEYIDPLRTLGQWARREEALWRQIRRERARDGALQHPTDQHPAQGIDFIKQEIHDNSQSPPEVRLVYLCLDGKTPFDVDAFYEARGVPEHRRRKYL